MSLYDITAAMTFVLTMYTGFVYVRKIVRGLANPTLSTWILFSTVTVLSSITNHQSPDRTLLSGVATDAGAVSATITLFVVLAVQGFRALRFTSLEKSCLLGAIFIGAGWFITDQYFVANLSLQGVMVIAYIPTIARIRSSSTHPEPFDTWILSFVTAVVGGVPAVVDGDILSFCYSLRGVACIGITLWFMWQLDQRTRLDTQVASV